MIVIKKANLKQITKTLEKEFNIYHRLEFEVLDGWCETDFEIYHTKFLGRYKTHVRWAFTPLYCDFHYLIYKDRRAVAYIQGCDHDTITYGVTGTISPFMKIFSISQNKEDIRESQQEIENIVQKNHPQLYKRLLKAKISPNFSINKIQAELINSPFMSFLN